MMRRSVGFGFALLLAACATPKDSEDTTTVLAVDTVKPATTPLPTPDTTKTADTVTSTKASTATKTKGAARDTSTKTGQTKELGRDSIIRINTKDKRRQLPLADTTKKP